MHKNYSPDFVMRGRLSEIFMEQGMSLDMISEIVAPMAGKTPEEKEAIAAKILEEKFNISSEQAH